MSETKPTARAMRAAEALASAAEYEDGCQMGEIPEERIAEIINEAAGLPDLEQCRVALEAIVTADDPPLPTRQEGESDAQYTDRLTGADGGNPPYPERRNRQCSIGYHEECSDPEGEVCKCPCHRLNERFTEARPHSRPARGGRSDG